MQLIKERDLPIPYMYTVFHARSDGRLIKIKQKLKRNFIESRLEFS